jgi:hypothetical protein
MLLTKSREEKTNNMLKKTIEYNDFNGDPVSEDFFFHLSKAELVEIELSHQGGLSESLKRIVAAEDGKAIIAEFKNIILGSYGQRSADGRRFIKNQALRDEFESTEAYSTLFMELVTDTDAAIEFVNGIIPTGMADEVAKLSAVDLKAVEEKVTVLPNPAPEPTIVTKDEVAAMGAEELSELGRRLASGDAKLES